MEFDGRYSSQQREEEIDLRRGPWIVQEDLTLMNYITYHGEGRWNSLARCAGLKRTGKSCRLRWLNYLRPDIRLGNITPEEQLLILELHSRLGNRWSKIAQHLPGRTDNEIKNYWRTRVKKHAKQLQCDVDSKEFKDVMRYLCMPRLLERIQAASGCPTGTPYHCLPELPNMESDGDTELGQPKASPESSSMAGSSSEYLPGTSISTPLPVPHCPTNFCSMQGNKFQMGDGAQVDRFGGWWPELLPSQTGDSLRLPEFDQTLRGEGITETLWSLEDIWSLQDQL